METKTQPGVVNCVAYAGGCRVADVAIEDISEVLKLSDQFVWIGLYEPGPELLQKVKEEFGLHELAIEDALLAHQRPKLERYGDSFFMALRTAQMNREKKAAEFGETHLFMGPRYIVSVRHGASLSYAPVRARCEANPRLLNMGPGFVLYAIMDFIVDQYFPVVDELESELQRLEEAIFGEQFSRDTTEAIYNLKRSLLELKRAVSPLVDICNRLVRFDVDLVPEEVASLCPGRLRSLGADQRDGGHPPRAPDLRAGGQSLADRGGPERLHEAARRRGPPSSRCPP